MMMMRSACFVYTRIFEAACFGKRGREREKGERNNKKRRFLLRSVQVVVLVR